MSGKISLEEAKKRGLNPAPVPLSAEVQKLQELIEEITRLTAEASGLKKEQIVLDLSPLHAFLELQKSHMESIQANNQQLIGLLMSHMDEEYKFTFRKLANGDVEATARIIKKQVN